MSRRKGEPTGDYLSPRRVAEILDLCEESIYRLINRGELDAVRIGRSIRLLGSQIDELKRVNQKRMEGSES